MVCRLFGSQPLSKQYRQLSLHHRLISTWNAQNCPSYEAFVARSRALSQYKDRLYPYRIHMIKRRRSHDRLIFIMGNPILTKRHFILRRPPGIWHGYVITHTLFSLCNRIWWLHRSPLVEVIKTISSAKWPLGSGITWPYKYIGNHAYLGLKNNRGIQVLEV